VCDVDVARGGSRDAPRTHRLVKKIGHGIPDLKITSPFNLAIPSRAEQIATPAHHGLIWIVFWQCAQETLHGMTNLDPGGGSTECDDLQGTAPQKVKIGEIKLTVTLPTAP
jgi:hypothetical protein